MSGDHHYTIRGLRVLWRYARLRGRAAGWSITPDAKRPHLERKVLIDSRLAGRARLETELHEAIHQFFPDLDESVVLAAGRDFSRILWSIGYRLHD